MTDRRPSCPRCGFPIDRIQETVGVFAAYPCDHWLTRDQAVAVRAQARAAREEA